MAIGSKMKRVAQKSNLRNAYSAYQRRTQGMGSSARVNGRPLQQKSTRSIGMTEPTPRSAGSMSVGSSPRRTNTASSAMSSRIKTAVDKRDYATPESNIGRKTRNKMITRKYGR